MPIAIWLKNKSSYYVCVSFLMYRTLWRHKLPGAAVGGDSGMGENYYFSGMGAGSRGGLVFAPQLEAWIARCQRTEAGYVKARRDVFDDNNTKPNPKNKAK